MPPFWKRVLLMPFSPVLWSEARKWTLSAVVLPLFVLATLWSAALATYRGFDLRHELSSLATEWDSKFDPVVLENGVARVEGSRLPTGEGKDGLMLVDPEETVPTPKSGKYIIVRKRTIIRDSGPSVDLKQLSDFFGGKPLRIDGQAVLAWLERWGFALQVGLLAFLVGFEWMGVLMSLLYGLIAGAILGSLFGKSRGVSGPECSRVGVATMAVKPVLGTFLALAGTSIHPCLGLFVWPALGVGLGAFALSRLPPVPALTDRIGTLP